MMRTLFAWLSLSLAAAMLLAGCGSSSGNSTSTNSTSTNSTSSNPTSSSSTSESTPSSTATTAAPKSPAVASAVESCKRGVKAIPTLSASTRGRIETICEKAASGNAAETRSAAREACEEIVKASPLPEGSLKQHAVAGCKSAEKK